MNKTILLLCLLLTIGLFTLSAESSSAPQTSSVEYVFTETELQNFLHENITEAVEKAVSETMRESLIREAVLQGENEKLKAQLSTANNSIIILKREGVVYMVGVGTAGLLIGLVVGSMVGN